MLRRRPVAVHCSRLVQSELTGWSTCIKKQQHKKMFPTMLSATQAPSTRRHKKATTTPTLRKTMEAVSCGEQTGSVTESSNNLSNWWRHIFSIEPSPENSSCLSVGSLYTLEVKNLLLAVFVLAHASIHLYVSHQKSRLLWVDDSKRRGASC